MQDLDGTNKPVITTAIWSANGDIHASDDWSEFGNHSADLLALDLSFLELPSDRLALVADIAAHLPARGESIELDAALRERLLSSGKSGLSEARALFAAIGIEV